MLGDRLVFNGGHVHPKSSWVPWGTCISSRSKVCTKESLCTRFSVCVKFCFAIFSFFRKILKFRKEIENYSPHLDSDLSFRGGWAQMKSFIAKKNDINLVAIKNYFLNYLGFTFVALK